MIQDVAKTIIARLYVLMDAFVYAPLWKLAIDLLALLAVGVISFFPIHQRAIEVIIAAIILFLAVAALQII